jgi:hypothetical protein
MLFGVSAPDTPGDGVWLIGFLPHGGSEGMAALSFWTALATDEAPCRP